MQLDTARRILTVNPPKTHPCLAVAWHVDTNGTRRYGWCYQHPRDVSEYIAPQPYTPDQLCNLAIEALKPGGATAGILGKACEAPRQSLTPPRGVPFAIANLSVVQPTPPMIRNGVVPSVDASVLEASEPEVTFTISTNAHGLLNLDVAEAAANYRLREVRSTVRTATVACPIDDARRLLADFRTAIDFGACDNPSASRRCAFAAAEAIERAIEALNAAPAPAEKPAKRASKPKSTKGTGNTVET